MSDLVRDEGRALSWWQEGLGRTLFDCLPLHMKKRALENADRLKELLLMDEAELRRKVHPTVLIHRLRMSFWEIFDKRRCSSGPKDGPGSIHSDKRSGIITDSEVYAGLCAREEYEIIVRNPSNLAWILKPPVSYQTAISEALYSGMNRLREIMELPIYSEEGKVDHKNIKVMMSAMEFFDKRLYGAMSQKMFQANTPQTVLDELHSSKYQMQADPLSILDKQIDEMQGKRKEQRDEQKKARDKAIETQVVKGKLDEY
jgi:hypothetical protein